MLYPQKKMPRFWLQIQKIWHKTSNFYYRHFSFPRKKKCLNLKSKPRHLFFGKHLASAYCVYYRTDKTSSFKFPTQALYWISKKSVISVSYIVFPSISRNLFLFGHKMFKWFLHLIYYSREENIHYSRYETQYNFIDGSRCMNLEYRTCPIITNGLYFLYPIFEDHFFVFKEVFQKILSFCMVIFQELFLIKSRLWWRTYGMSKAKPFGAIVASYIFSQREGSLLK